MYHPVIAVLNDTGLLDSWRCKLRPLHPGNSIHQTGSALASEPEIMSLGLFPGLDYDVPMSLLVC